MSRIVLDSDLDLIQGHHEEVCHREAFVRAITAGMQAAPRPPRGIADDYDDWYLGVIRDGVFRRVLVVEHQEWTRNVEDLLRDQLSRNGIDSGWWDEVKEAETGSSLVARIRQVFADRLDAELPSDVWQSLEEIHAVAETIGQATREARQLLRDSYPDYFAKLDAFGDGDPVGRMTLEQHHAERAFAAVKRFWTGLPYRLVEDGAA